MKRYTALNSSYRSKGRSADKSLRTAGMIAHADAPMERLHIRVPLFVRVIRCFTRGGAAR